MFRRHASGFRTLLMVSDGLVAIGLLVAVSVGRFGDAWLTHWQPFLAEPAAFAVLYAAVWVIVLWVHALYRPRARWNLRGEAIAIARAILVMALISGSVLFAFRLPDISRTFLVVLFPAQWLVTLVSRLLLRVAFERLRARGYNQRFVLVVGTGEEAMAFARKVEDHRELGLEVRGFLDDERGDLPKRWKYLGRLDRIEEVLHSQVVDEVAVCLPIDRWEHLTAIIRLCEEEGKIVRVPMGALDAAFSRARVEDLDGTPVYSFVNGPDRAVALLVKRALDVVSAAAGLVLLSPVLLGVALAIRLRDGSPVLFRQVRVGLHGREFTVLKFRTMVTDAEARYADVEALSDIRGAAFKMTNDPRITPTGRVMRRLSLDELPQLWNVLRGEMSLVGPRPAPPREVAGYDLWHRRRLSMKPGITGLWQVTARQSDDFDNRAQLDLSYIDRWSLLLDLRILLRTLPAAFEGR